MADTCRSCGAPIVWGKTQLGKPCPYDLDAVTGGIVMVPRKTPGADPRQSHFSSCPNARSHSKKVAK
ncbi:MAG: hypothetical protein KGL39_47705 [Patescibacteria group bacterium]|nr:hypothetical protein [Patescibacteria group bacterium]